MKFYRMWALVERDLRKFFRSPALMMASMIFPLVQLIVLGYAFGGKITNVNVGEGLNVFPVVEVDLVGFAFRRKIKNVDGGVVDLDHTAESWRVREGFAGI